MLSTSGPRQQIEARLAETFRSNHALIARRDALKAGLSSASVTRRLRSGAWTRVLPNVYRLSAAPEAKDQALAAAILWAGPNAALSHRSALKLWGGTVHFDSIEVMTPQRRDALPGVEVHQVRRLPPEHVTTREGLQVTTPERTLLDIASLGDHWLLETALQELLEARVLGFRSLRKFLEHPSTRGLPGRRFLLKVAWSNEDGRMAEVTGGFAECVRNFMLREDWYESELPEENVQVGDVEVPLAMSRWKVAIVPRGEAELCAAVKAQGWRVVAMGVDDLECDPEFCAFELARAVALAGGTPPGPRRKSRVWRYWMEPRSRMDLQFYIQSWRRSQWGWFHLGERFLYSPVERREIALGDAFPEVFRDMTLFRLEMESGVNRSLPKSGLMAILDPSRTH